MPKSTFPIKTHSLSQMKSWSISSEEFIDSENEFRIDANRYNPSLKHILKNLTNHSNMKIERLGDIVSRVYLPPRFRRNYVTAEHGIPFIQGKQIIQFRLDDLKYLSRKTHGNSSYLFIKEGWILITRSGTVGRVVMCPKEWNGWIASEHVIRIIPDENKCSGGYLYSFLASPFGQIQLISQIYGAVVDELTDIQIENVLIPLPKTEKDKRLMQSINTAIGKSISKRSEALSLVNKSIAKVRPSIKKVENPRSFPLPVNQILAYDELRIDAGCYNPSLLHVHDLLSKMKTIRIGDVAEVFRPGLFKRVFVGSQHGLPYLQGNHMLGFQVSGFKYLSRRYEKIDELIVKTGWLLVTCSGTAGRVVMCPKEWNGWVVTQDLIRIVPDEDKCPSGYLCSFLSSPLGQIQMTSQTYGSVVDRLSENHVRDILIPVPSSQEIKEIDSIMKKGMDLKSQAVEEIETSIEKLTNRFKVDGIDHL